MSSDNKKVMEFAHHLPVNVHSLPRGGKEMHLVSDAVSRAHLAKNHGLVAVEHFEAHFRLTPRQKGNVQLKGVLTAHLVQHCVISGEAISQQISDDFSLLFVPLTDAPANEGEVIIDVQAEDEDDREFYDGIHIDLGAVVEEFFELALDPYPRKEGAEFSPFQIGEDRQEDRPPSPFSLLKKLTISQ